MRRLSVILREKVYGDALELDVMDKHRTHAVEHHSAAADAAALILETSTLGIDGS